MTTAESISTSTPSAALRAAVRARRRSRRRSSADPRRDHRRTGYVGAELVRLLRRHPNVELVGLLGRGREHDPIGGDPPAPRDDRPRRRRRAAAGRRGLPGASPRVAAGLVPDLVAGGTAHRPGARLPPARPGRLPALVRLRASRGPTSSTQAVYGLPELHRAELSALVERRGRSSGAPGCYPTATLLALAPLARAGPDRRPRGRCQERRLGRRPRGEGRPDVRRGQREREGVRHRRPSHVAEIEQELAEIAAWRPSRRGRQPRCGRRRLPARTSSR